MATAKSNPSANTFDAEELVALARIDLERGNLEAALSKLKTVVAGDTPPAEGVGMAARLYAQLGLYDRARKLFESFLKLKPGALVETFQLGMAHFDAGQANEALAIWEKLLKEHPTHPPALFYKALIMAQQGAAADARKTLEILMKSAPPDNLYFGRAKELLHALETGAGIAAPARAEELAAKSNATTSAKGAYKTEH